ncbi:MAG: alpha/beta family hydrolase [Microbacterium sp.]|uniref:alpha/beta hydrolase family protein n=1 Tax=Microbacterium sp. TaxID=51671 RepID=UPI003A865129
MLPTGAVEVSAAVGMPSRPWAAVALAHGAGAGHRHPFLVGLADALRDSGVAVLRFDFPYREAGRRMPGPAGHATATWAAVMAQATSLVHEAPVFAAGKSYGGRMASMAAAEGLIAPEGLVYLGYPLHPPGRPDRLRVEHLPAIAQPQLFLAGTNDPFVQPPEQLVAAVTSCRSAELVWIDGGGHSFEVKGARPPAETIGAGLAPPVIAWMRSQPARSAGV